ncbi:uncharacterized protein BXIN_2603 [Babesia sp. Xinjiang]|uniref:uncharacterized protein n=1 Tax=Babesia sp. Xinjiang TaxID=462227 RepID=UPI000A24444E|nr:uncharacterized protein BXIN_2718 [Babesia sp. Xinjiang]XP_028872059.1 uncharacterized protein BXIN_2603 [Babesia sp. Xinjiang]ORM41560.1 hypothetical protein BXIN_2718 [Babesia sp. Xinjiang]ORM41603.1 hypothetical protein BXIN_2603 [Babesia sp. Xinjiang]
MCALSRQRLAHRQSFSQSLLFLWLTMTSRVVCKLREIIAEVTGNARSDYVTSLRDEHREELLQGRKAYAIDNDSSEITLFVPWRLHRPIEMLFQRIAVDSRMSTAAFRKLVDGAALFPRSQSSRKKDDILEYILGRVVDIDSVDFEQFLHALFLLAKYRAAVLRVTEQCAFNHMLTTLIGYGIRTMPQRQGTVHLGDSGNKADYESTLGSSPRSSIHENELLRAMTSATIKKVGSPTASSTEGDALQRAITRAISQHNDNETDSSDRDTAKSGSSNAMQLGMSSCDSVDTEKQTLQPFQTDHLFRMAEDKMNETCELLKNELLTMRAQLDDYKVHESHRQELIHKISVLKGDNERLQNQMDTDAAAAKEKQQQLESTITELNEELSAVKKNVAELEEQLQQAKQQIEAAENYRSHQQQVQTLIALQRDYESMLFSAFVSYRDDALVGGEFVMSEDSCIAFCLDFGLDEIQLAAGSNVDPAAKVAYKDVVKSSSSGKLTYGLFKEFLLRLAEIVDPQSTQKRAFQLLLL